MLSIYHPSGLVNVALLLTSSALVLPRSNAYYMVLHKHGDRLYAGVIATLSTQLKKVAAQVRRCRLLKLAAAFCSYP